MKEKLVLFTVLGLCGAIAVTSFLTTSKFSAGGPTEMLISPTIFTMSATKKLEFTDANANTLEPELQSENAMVLTGNVLAFNEPGVYTVTAKFLSLTKHVEVLYGVFKVEVPDGVKMYSESVIGFKEIKDGDVVTIETTKAIWIAREGKRAKLFTVEKGAFLDVPSFVEFDEGVLKLNEDSINWK